MSRSLSLLCLVALTGVAVAGPYSSHSNDPTNPSDPPVASTDGRIVAWSDAVVDYSPAPGVGVFADWQTGEEFPEVGYRSPTTGIGSLGDLYSTATPPPTGEVPPFSGATQPFSGDVTDTDDEYGFIGHDAPGSITVSFPRAIRNGPGHDFAVFENGPDFGSGLVADLAYVEVSTDGVNFARFDGVSLNTDYLDAAFGAAYGTIDETNVYNLAGKHLDGWGTPFELSELVSHPMVTAGTLDLENVQFVRMVDIPGSADGSFLDSQGNDILDAWVTLGSAGFDFRLSEGVAVLNAAPVPEPGTLALLAIALAVVGFVCKLRR